MLKALISDFSYVILFPKDKAVSGSINRFHESKTTDKTYDLFDYFYLNEEYLFFLSKIKADIPLYIFTTGHIQNDSKLRERLEPIFTDVISVREFGLEKDDKRSYEELVKNLGFAPEEVIFIDDTEKNIIAASEAGLQTILYVSNDDLLEKLEKALE